MKSSRKLCFQSRPLLCYPPRFTNAALYLQNQPQKCRVAMLKLLQGPRYLLAVWAQSQPASNHDVLKFLKTTKISTKCTCSTLKKCLSLPRTPSSNTVAFSFFYHVLTNNQLSSSLIKKGTIERVLIMFLIKYF